MSITRFRFGLGVLILSFGAAATAFLACGGGDDSSDAVGGAADAAVTDSGALGDGAQKDSASSGSFDVTLADASLESELRAVSSIQVTVTPVDGFSGTAALSATGLPLEATATFQPSTVDLGAGPAQSLLLLSVPARVSSMPAAIVIHADNSGIHATANLSLTVNRVLTIPISMDAADAALPYGPVPIVLTLDDAGISAGNPITVNFFNHDTVAHEIHADQDGQGFGHDPGLIAPGMLDPLVRNVNAAGTYDFYLHDVIQPDGGPPANTRGRLIVQ